MTSELELIRTKATLRYLAEKAELPDAERLLHTIRETTAFLERRIAREKLAIAKSGQVDVQSEFVRVS